MRRRCPRCGHTILEFVKAICCRSEMTMVTHLEVAIKTMEDMRVCKPRHSFIITFQTDFGKRTARFDARHWRCREVIINRDNEWVHKMRLEMRDNNNNVMEYLVIVENKHCRNKVCLDNLFTQLGFRRWQFVNIR